MTAGNDTKTFPLRVLLSITTGRLLTKRAGPRDNGIGALYDLLGWMTNDSPFTHQLPRFSDECKPWLLRWFPELASAAQSLHVLDEKIKTLGAEKGVEFWLTNMELVGLKAEYDVPRIPADDHEKRNPVDEAAEMMGPEKVIIAEFPKAD